MAPDIRDMAARELADILHSDSQIPQIESVPLLREALERDVGLPTPDEMVILVEGDEDGEIDEGLTKRFPHVMAAIGYFF